jgi:hypothetical protein
MTVVLFGNPAPQMQVTAPDGTRYSQPAEHLTVSETRVEFWSGFDDQAFADLSLSSDNDRFLSLIGANLSATEKKYAVGINELEQIIAVHTAGAAPDWIWSDDPVFAQALATHFTPPVPVLDKPPNALLTSGGRDALHAQHMSTSAQPASFNYMALTANSTAPAGGDTTLTGEITTASGGLIRAQATYAHTTGTNTTTLTKTFTANGSDVLPVTIAKIGVFNASSSGTMAYETLLSASATLNIVGDNVAITETVTAG